MSDLESEHLRAHYEQVVKHNAADIIAVHYLAVWHLERHSFQQARKYFGHLATLRREDPDVWLCLSVCCSMAEEFNECTLALSHAKALIPDADSDLRVRFCYGLMAEKFRDYTTAMEVYMHCLADTNKEAIMHKSTNSDTTGSTKLLFFTELKGELMLRIALLKKEMGAVDQALQMCTKISTEPFGQALKANALCLKGLIHEMKAEFPASEVVYRSVLQIVPGHSTALERLGRVYLRYRETIPAAVQCFFKSVETNPSNHVAWYLLGRCYMATSQYSDACEAYNRAVNLNPNDPQVWCSLGVLYYAFGQYREALGMLARALKLDATMADAWYNVGALYDMCNQPEDAQKAYLKAKENGLADRFARAGLGLNPLSMQSLQFTDNSEYEHSDGNGIGQQNSGYGRNHRPSGNSSHQNSNNQTNAELVSNSGNLSFHPPHTTESSSHNIQQSSNNSSNSSHISQQQWSHNQQHQEPRQLQSEHQSSSHLEEHLHQHLRQVQSLSPLQHDSGYIAYGNDDLYQQHQGQALAQALEDLVRDDDSGERGR